MNRVWIICAALLLCVRGFAQSVNWNDSVQTYTEQARWGDAQAYEKLARCYLDGQGVAQRDFLHTLNLLNLAEEFDAQEHLEPFMDKLSADNADFVFYKALVAAERGSVDEAMVLVDFLADANPSRSKMVLALLAHREKRDTDYSRLMQEAAREGCKMAMSYLCVNDDTMWTFDERIKVLQQMSKTSPIAYARIGELYEQAGILEEAVHHFLLADKYACLDIRLVNKLLEYYHKGDVKLSEQDVRRFQHLERLAFDAWKKRKR